MFKNKLFQNEEVNRKAWVGYLIGLVCGAVTYIILGVTVVSMVVAAGTGVVVGGAYLLLKGKA